MARASIARTCAPAQPKQLESSARYRKCRNWRKRRRNNCYSCRDLRRAIARYLEIIEILKRLDQGKTSP